MLSLEHELPLQFIDKRPDLPLVLASECGLWLPPYAKVTVASGDVSRTGSVTERRVDRILLMHDEHGKTVGALLVEVQRSIDPEARRRWPGKLSEALERHGCDVYLLVVCTDTKVFRWASKPVHAGDPNVTGLMARALPVSPEAIPLVQDVEEVLDAPELAALSVLSHGTDREHNRVLPTFLEALTLQLENPRPDARLSYPTEQYVNFVYDAASAGLRRQMEEHMTTTKGYFRYSIPFLRDAQDKAYEEACEEVYEKAYEKAYEQAYEKARKELHVETKPMILLELLSARGVDIDEDQRCRVRECTDDEQLDTWVRRAATATRAEDIFD